ncbi:hypothetical protein FOXG_22564 [Fusarium oxysporum f. sp. lycopersici 4287]|uniref:Uncharacterized protein n=1 Tax=Fusarium oxysporum f. sp. lycopersici (strain 4287 / CBS 123668 / FGSC 9935 / NRRL 34936) TaxID=426428 RepID=A0A0J9WVD8_FUSO4|nr:hypothetical protein FOXG_22536 [Fusarium oxysporum f. sp. lycopersici 4287]XP_018257486.1 hypothetical protein FOXG_22564 [Fusarium oxysporum f. sp. lycopersici 4287]KNB19357.1 hypothetical protein FOXG_22536 [Fusarium oxysporum f. sp. lycopersici 4287]KNB19441.1 hypothetical protein FOXG_22564 [Fusarium oxysporum f. sp. lycopersici 4287]
MYKRLYLTAALSGGQGRLARPGARRCGVCGDAALLLFAAVLIITQVICKASCVGAVYMLELFLYASPQKAHLYP